jgi:hypothetical protein
VKGPANYSRDTSPCCDDSGHRPGSEGPFYCMSCGELFDGPSLDAGPGPGPGPGPGTGTSAEAQD